MAQISRDPMTSDLMIRISQNYAIKPDPRSVVAGLETEIRTP